MEKRGCFSTWRLLGKGVGRVAGFDGLTISEDHYLSFLYLVLHSIGVLEYLLEYRK